MFDVTDTYNGTYPCLDTTFTWTDYSYTLISTSSNLNTWEFEKDGDFSSLDYYNNTSQILDSFSCVNYQAYISDSDTSYIDSYYSDWEFSSNKEEIEIDLGLGFKMSNKVSSFTLIIQKEIF